MLLMPAHSTKAGVIEKQGAAGGGKAAMPTGAGWKLAAEMDAPRKGVGGRQRMVLVQGRRWVLG